MGIRPAVCRSAALSGGDKARFGTPGADTERRHRRPANCAERRKDWRLGDKLWTDWSTIDPECRCQGAADVIERHRIDARGSHDLRYRRVRGQGFAEAHVDLTSRGDGEELLAAEYHGEEYLRQAWR